MGKLQKLALLIRTVRYLKPIQIINRVMRNISSTAVLQLNLHPIRKITPQAYFLINRNQSLLINNEFNFLNKSYELSFPEGWNDQELPKLWLYNLHYFEGLLNNETSRDIKQNFIQTWVKQNPIGYGNGWEPYPTSLRIVNWIKWHLSTDGLNEENLNSLAIQVRYLTKTIEYHLLGNHLFANAKALVFAGLFFEGPEADEWFKIGFNILDKQIPEQFLDDGAHFELSTTYHALLTEDLLDIIQLMNMTNKEVPIYWEESAHKAVHWLTVMTRPDGLPPLFNDAAYGITPSLDDILSLYNAIGFKVSDHVNNGMIDLSESGYFRYNADKYSLFGDAGPIGPDYIPGHAHCDMLNFELFAHGKPIIIDTGISTYEVGTRRQLERSTVSHNTVQISDTEQSEIWGAFRVARRAQISQRTVTKNSVTAAYVGYKKPKIEHTRKFSFNPECILIEDKINQTDMATARLHFHPDILVEIKDGYIKAGSIKIEFSNQVDVILKKYEYAPEFNKLLSADALEITFSEQLTTKVIL
ncbi:alginate lyase family protein [Emcibacteraceae bacterium]|nr:alginate lyase family protein [Emcibacteraceae bacterium]